MTTKHDGGKQRWDLLPLEAVTPIVDVLTFGAQKYAPDNWRTVPEWRSRYYAAALRHLSAWWMGENLDRESGLPHLAHAGCCLLFLAALDKLPTNDPESPDSSLEAPGTPKEGA